MDRDLILESFQDISQIQDYGECIQILESVDWNLDSALNSIDQGSNFATPETGSQTDNFGSNETRNLHFNVDVRGQMLSVIINEDKKVRDLAELVAKQCNEPHSKFKISGFKMPFDSNTQLKSLNLGQTNNVVANPIEYSSTLSTTNNSENKKFHLGIDVSYNAAHYQKLNLIFDGKDTIGKVKTNVATLLGNSNQNWTGWPDHICGDDISLRNCGIPEYASFTVDAINEPRNTKPRFRSEGNKIPIEVSLNNSRIDEPENDDYDDNTGNVLGNQYQLNDDSSDCNSTLPKPVTNPYYNYCMSTPSCFQYFVNKRSDLLSNETAEQGSMLSSPIYTGGCIKTVKFCEDTYVIYCDGTNMSKLTINKINEKTNSLEKTNIYQYEIKDERIFQIDVAEYADYFVILIRFLSSIESLKLDKTEEKLIIESISANNSMDQFISCKLDSSWPRTYASSFSDKIHIYDTKKKQNVWCKDITNSVIDHWNEIQSTNISQTWLFTDRSSSYLYDARTNPFSPAVELFNNRARSLSANESFYHATNVFNSNNYYVFSTFNAVLLDIRSPFSVVSQWTVPNMSPVSYSSVKYLPTLNEFNITVGYQMKAKHSIFQQNKKNTKSTCLGSKPHNSYDTIMSLGIATVFNERSNMLSVLTLDNKGNVLGNQYQLNDENSDCNSTLPKPVTNQYHCISTKRFKQSIPTDEPLIDIERLAPYENWKDFSMKTEKNNKELLFRSFGIDNIKKDKSSN